jgi:hypothetical protein
VFHSEHNKVLTQIKGFLTAVGEDNPASIAIGNSTNNLIADLGLTEQQTFTESVMGTAVVGTGTVRAGNLLINDSTIAITNGSTLDQVVTAINAVKDNTGVAAVNNAGRLELLNQFHTDVLGNVWTGEMLFQAAKLVTEMEYQHLVFGEFVRKFSPNITAFAAYNIDLDPAITAEFANAVYRFGHSMLTETVAMTGYDPLTGLSNGQDNSIGLIEAFINPLAYKTDTAGQVALGMSGQVGNAIDEWVTDALRNNLVGLPLDLATLNIVRGRDTGMGTLNEVRASLFASTGLSSLKPHDTWDEFAANLLHHESLENFIMA